MRTEYDFSKGKRGAVMPQKGKTRISIFIDNSVLDEFRARAEKAGTGYQTMMNEALRNYLTETEQPVTEKVLRHVLRQEIPEYLRGLTPRSARTRR
jgi:hypothetical protein